MPERRNPSSSNAPARPSVRRNLFPSHLRTTHTASSTTTPTHLSHPSHPIAPLPRRPTTSSTSTSAETLRLDHGHTYHSHSNSHDRDLNTNPFPQNGHASRNGSRNHSSLSFDGTTDIVMRDKNGNFDIANMMLGGGMDNGGGLFGGGDEDMIGIEGEEEKERQRLNESIKHHQRDRNRAPSEPAELLEAVRNSLRAKTAALSEDNWMFEAENEGVTR
ncbi:3ce7c2e9-6b15-4569-b1b9-d3a5ba00c59a [Sclerotinia trifoliorum]|uniref:3ce7c2e9-6b15-4569-b1b9-d3a5ba00c59a n=1 Tax=Sclerotinia trifoliorum TaxID=28548 RepID=A0A8H2ZSN5_9HELO|nr:3ce7c2e9-6b15-4569-b1b9-d3a5ba00c59a [Sclerotinia trifoliorum]